ncbi:MAG: protein translocase subunit SecD [Candidatus Moraniibacteriota bacterium]|nr:MAG: protein translocase subunit SecD [Candidatus Moranbacteria bacterium]
MNAIQKIRYQFAGVVLLALLSSLVAYPKLVSFIPPVERFFSQAQVNLGLDLQGGIHLEYAADTSEVDAAKRDDALQAAVDVIERRVNAFGVGEPVVQLSRSGDESRIIVELPGVKDVEEAKSMIKETPFLEFRELAGPEAEEQIATANAQSEEAAGKILENALSGMDFAELAKTWSQDPGSKDNGGEYDFAKKGYYVPEFDAVTFDPSFQKGTVWSSLVETSFGWHILKKIDERGEGDEREVKIAHILFPKYSIEQFPNLRFKATGLSGKNLENVFVDYQSQGIGSPQISLQFDDEGAKLFADITARNIDKPVVIMIDGEVVSQPTVQAEIRDGQAVITGDFTLPEANALVKRFNEGALPVPITLDAQQSIDASLGKSALDQSVTAGIYGLAAVSVFMLLFYRFLGFIAVLALLLYSAMLLALFKLSVFTPFPITLTLSGIAGFVLSIGIAVDANVLIFERTREELSFGKSMRKALHEGFRRAWPSIRDGHLSTIITTVILIGMGTGFVKGFALILALGVLLSLFTAVVLVRIMVDFLFSDWMERHPWILVTPKKLDTPKD